jgi:hypothetical protein
MSDFSLFCSETVPNHKQKSYEAAGLPLWFVCGYLLLGQSHGCVSQLLQVLDIQPLLS